MTDPLAEIKARRALLHAGEAFPDPSEFPEPQQRFLVETAHLLREVAADIDTLIGEVERLRAEVFELKIYRGFGQDHGHQRCVEEIKRLQAEVADLKITLATASPGAYFSRYGERPALSELRRAASPAGDAPPVGS
jgi:hypothetical protein